MDVASGLSRVRESIREACVASGRDPADVTLVAVSKRFPAEVVAAARAAGQVDFGESYGQELRDKSAALGDGPRWHFIGRIQANKARYIAPVAWRVHALEDVAQAEALARRAPGVLSCLVEVNLGREASKGGVLPEQTLERVAALSAIEGVRITGLMGMPPLVDDPEDAAPFFAELADLAARGRAAGFALDELSMGTTQDYPVAIRHGATFVRVGEAIFGPRPR